MYTAKKYVMLFMCGIIPAITFVVGLISGLDIIMAMIMVFVISFVMSLMAAMLLKHPLTQLIEGKGMLTLTLDSTGFIECFLVTAEEQPFVHGMFRKKMVETMFDRDITQYLIPPQPGRLVTATMIDSHGRVVGKRKVLVMPSPKEKADYLFSFGNYPTFIYNKVLGTFLQKSLLSNFEQNTFTKHAVMYLLKKTEELSSSVRDFARYIVEQIRPKKSWLAANRWIIYLIIAAAIILFVVIFAPSIINSLQGTKLPSLPGGGTTIP
jgi:hypothetical protein